MNAVIQSLLMSLGLTLVVELSLSLILGIRRGKELLIVALANLLTNPVVNYCGYWAIYLFTYRSMYTALIILMLELGAVAAESFLYKHLLHFQRFSKLKLSLLLNAASFLAGIAVSLLIK